jgi:hypothetical protein
MNRAYDFEPSRPRATRSKVIAPIAESQDVSRYQAVSVPVVYAAPPRDLRMFWIILVTACICAAAGIVSL